MPNYNLVIDSTFQPFTFEEMLQPVLLAQSAHQEVENAFTDLSIRAGEFESLAESERTRNGEDSETYRRYSSYANDLRNQADSLMREGLTSGVRNRVLDLRRRYSTDIEPIRIAAERHRSLMDERRQQEKANPTLRHERGYDEVGIDELILNPSLDYGRSYSGDLIEQQVYNAARALSNNIRENPDSWQPILGGQYYQRQIQKGYTPEEVLLASMGDSNAPEELRTLIENAIENSGVSDWEGIYNDNGSLTSRGESIINDVRMFAGRGLNGAIGSSNYERVQNSRYIYDLQQEAARAAAEAAALSGGGTPSYTVPEILDAPISESNRSLARRLRDAFGANEEEIMAYVQSLNRNGDFKNPLVEGSPTQETPFWEELYENMRRNPISPIPGIGAFRQLGNYVEDYFAYDPASERLDLLRTLGLSESSTKEEFENLPELIDNAITASHPVNINLSNYDREAGLMTNLWRNNNSLIYEYSGDNTLGKPIDDIEDVLQENSNGSIVVRGGITSMGIDPLNLEYIRVDTPYGSYSVHASVFDYTLSETLKRTKEMWSTLRTREEQEKTLAHLVSIAQAALDDFAQRRGNTSSNYEY